MINRAVSFEFLPIVFFGCLEWSSSETQIVYVAEMKQPKKTSHFDPKKPKEGSEDEVLKVGNLSKTIT